MVEVVIAWIVSHPFESWGICVAAAICLGLFLGWRADLRDVQELEEKRSKDELWKEG